MRIGRRRQNERVLLVEALGGLMRRFDCFFVALG